MGLELTAINHDGFEQQQDSLQNEDDVFHRHKEVSFHI